MDWQNLPKKKKKEKDAAISCHPLVQQQEEEEDPSLRQVHVRAASRPLPRSIQNQIPQDNLTQSPASHIYGANFTPFL